MASRKQDMAEMRFPLAVNVVGLKVCSISVQTGLLGEKLFHLFLAAILT
jgi:hypothetical protein